MRLCLRKENERSIAELHEHQVVVFLTELMDANASNAKTARAIVYASRREQKVTT